MSIYDEIVQFMNQGKYRKPAKMLFSEFQKLDPSRVNEFGDMLVTLSKQYPDLYKDKIYTAFMFLTRKMLKNPILMELDKYIINKYCLLEGEKLATIFYGKVMDNFNHTNGRVFVTNARIITSGFQMATSGTSSPGSKSLIGTVRLMKKEAVHLAIRKAIRKSLQADLAQFEILEYANSTPIAGAIKIKRGKKNFTYVVNVPYERKGKQQIESVSVTIAPDKTEDIPKVLDIVEDVIKAAQ